MSYYIAYLDNKNKGFMSGPLPWIYGPVDFDDIHETYSSLKSSGCNSITPFSVKYNIPETVTWQYVNANKI